MTSSLKHLTVASLMLLASALGCESPDVAPSTTEEVAAAKAPAPAAEPAKPMVAAAPGKELPPTEEPVTDIPRKFISSDPVQGRRSRREAKEGTNVLGIGSSVAAGMYAKHQAFIIAIDHGNQLYWGRNNLEYAKTQEEFMKEVVELSMGGNPLPKLEDDHEYCYVPSQPEVGLQIRLKPGSPKSKVPAGTSPEDAIKMLGGGEAGEAPAPSAAAPTTGLQNPAEQPESKGGAAPADPSAAAEEPEPTYDIRSRAEGLGKAANDRTAEEQQ